MNNDFKIVQFVLIRAIRILILKLVAYTRINPNRVGFIGNR